MNPNSTKTLGILVARVPQDPNEMTEEEAQQILDALQQQEKELQEDLQKKKQQGVKLKILKDW